MTTAIIARPVRRLSAYLDASRSPRYSVLFALPLLAGYEALAAMSWRPGAGGLRNGADAILRSAFVAVAGSRGPTILMGVIIVCGLWLVVRDVRKTRDRPRLPVFAAMFAESAVLAVLFGLVIGAATAKLLGSLHTLSLGQIEQSSWSTRLMLSLGAGLYEELFFRVLLVSGLAAGVRLLLGFGPRGAAIVAAMGSALIFSAFHYIGPYGDSFRLSSFVFRTLSGLAFSGMYLVRGFGITAWTHALYDAFLLLA